MTMWAVVPVRLAPFAGWTIATAAGDEGRAPLETGDATEGLGLDEEPPTHPDARSARAMHAPSVPARVRTLELRLTG